MVSSEERARVISELGERMRDLYRTGEYWVSIPRAPGTGFEASYWGEVTDPDGRVRRREEERDQYLADVDSELAFIAGREPGRVLDVGCGRGWLLSALDARIEKFGIEISELAAGEARRFATIHRGTLDDCPFENGSFDLVICHHVIEHLEDPARALRQMRELLRPGGTLILATPDFDSGAARRFGANYRLLHDGTHISLFSSDSMHRFLRDHGFRIFRVDYPYFETRHFTKENLRRLFDTSQISPPFYGNFMTFYCARSI